MVNTSYITYDEERDKKVSSGIRNMEDPRPLTPLKKAEVNGT